MPWFAPCPRNGGMACAESPTRTTRPRCQRLNPRGLSFAVVTSNILEEPCNMWTHGLKFLVAAVEFGLTFFSGGSKGSIHRFNLKVLKLCGHWDIQLLSRDSKKDHVLIEPLRQLHPCGSIFNKLSQLTRVYVDLGSYQRLGRNRCMYICWSWELARAIAESVVSGKVENGLKFLNIPTPLPTPTRMNLHIHIHMDINISIHIHTHMHMHIHMQKHMHTHKNIHTHIHIFIDICICICMYIHKIHKHIHLHVRMHIHAYMT